MLVLRTTAALVEWRRGIDDQKVAFVPTMGFLHRGHVSLMEEARARVPKGEGSVIVSIFVNPSQFNDPQDLASYPRDEAGDLEKSAAADIDVVFVPDDPREVFSKRSRTWVNVKGLDEILCGFRRPGHFKGVCTVVAKLWNLVRPDFTVFGQKDFQQLAIIRQMHEDLFLSGEVASVPIVREIDGLAMSSRNARLTQNSRRAALEISTFLGSLPARVAAGERSVAELLSDAGAQMSGGELEYAEIRDALSLRSIEFLMTPCVCVVAATYGGVRLIDNIVLNPGH